MKTTSVIVPLLATVVTSSPVNTVSDLIGQQMVQYCDASNQGGTCDSLNDNLIEECQAPGHAIESMKVFDGYQCTLYQSEGCGGWSKTYDFGTYDTIDPDWVHAAGVECFPH